MLVRFSCVTDVAVAVLSEPLVSSSSSSSSSSVASPRNRVRSARMRSCVVVEMMRFGSVETLVPGGTRYTPRGWMPSWKM